MSANAILDESYRTISRSSIADAPKTYADFHAAVEGLRPGVDELCAMSWREESAEEALRAARTMLASNSQVLGLEPSTGGSYFKGSGLIMLGDRHGVVAVSHSLDADGRDLVAEQYPGYERAALRKLGQAALLAKISEGPVGCYERLQEALLSAGVISDGEPPHHLGYAFDFPDLRGIEYRGRINDYFMAAGATGMLPAPAVDERMQDYYPLYVDRDTQAGWVDWPHDRFAGFHDMVAAEAAVANVLGYPMPQLSLVNLHSRGVNLH